MLSRVPWALAQISCQLMWRYGALEFFVTLKGYNYIPSQYSTKPPRPTQPGRLSVGRHIMIVDDSNGHRQGRNDTLCVTGLALYLVWKKSCRSCFHPICLHSENVRHKLPTVRGISVDYRSWTGSIRRTITLQRNKQTTSHDNYD